MPNTDKVRKLNDAFRTTLNGGKLLITRGIAARSDVPAVLEKVRTFNAFDMGNDPWDEHDFGAFEVDDPAEKIFFKIDYYDLDLHGGSPDPGDESVTTRVLTLMLASEY